MVEVAESDFVDGAGVYMRCLESDQVADSAVLGGLLLSDRLWARADESASFLQRKLAVSTGGLARYEKDYYFRAVESEPGNPWVISTMWMSQWLSQIGDTDGALQHIEWAAERSETTGILAEQYHPLSGAPQSVSPLTWSHSQYIEAVLALERALENKGGD
jgi:GH15 family glucan-1,4-alpha-glucosidase